MMGVVARLAPPADPGEAVDVRTGGEMVIRGGGDLVDVVRIVCVAAEGSRVEAGLFCRGIGETTSGAGGNAAFEVEATTELKKASNESSGSLIGSAGARGGDEGKEAMEEVCRLCIGGWTAERLGAEAIWRGGEARRIRDACVARSGAVGAGSAPKLSLKGSKGSNVFDVPLRAAGRAGASASAPISPPKSSSGGADGRAAADLLRRPNSPPRGLASSSSCFRRAGSVTRPISPLASASKSSERKAGGCCSLLLRGDGVCRASELPAVGDEAGRLRRLKKRPTAPCCGSGESTRPDSPC